MARKKAGRPAIRNLEPQPARREETGRGKRQKKRENSADHNKREGIIASLLSF